MNNFEIHHHKHIEYFYSSSKKFCDCGAKNIPVYSWGSYVNRKFHTIKLFCIKCFEKSVKENLITHQRSNNCHMDIKGLHNERLPNFLLELKKLLNGDNQQSLFA